MTPNKAAKKISRLPNMGAIHARTGDKRMRQTIEKTAP